NAAPMPGVQGTLKAQGVGAGELSNNVAIVRLGELGAPLVLARYQGNQRLPDVGVVTPPTNATAVPTLIPTVAPTATPEGLVLTIKSSRQNVRSGPGDQYEVLGQL